MAKPVDNSVRESALASTSEPPAPSHALPRNALPRDAIPRHSGFLHPTGVQRPSGITKAGLSKTSGIAKVHPGEQANDVSVADTIRSANVTLEQESAQHLSFPLSLAIQQRDHYITEWCREREARQQDAARVAAELDEQRTRHQAELAVLRDQLRDAERELASVRPEPRTIIGVAPAKRVLGETAPSTPEDASLRASLEAAWLDVEDARSRLTAVETERDQAIKEADDLRVELYDKLAAARDEVIEAENRLTELQRAFDDAKEQWEEELARLRSELEVSSEVGAASNVAEASDPVLPLVEAHAPVNYALVPPPRDSLPALSGDYATADDVPPVHYDAPAPAAAAPQPTLSALLGFESSPDLDSEPPYGHHYSQNDDQSAEAAIGRRSKGFGLRRLFRSSKPPA
jgi:hypothetical protein